MLSDSERDALRVLGYALLQHRRFDQALTLFEVLALNRSDDEHANNSLSYLYLNTRRYRSALARARRWRDRSARQPGSEDLAAARLLESRALRGLRRDDAATAAFDAYLAARAAARAS